MRNFMTDKPPRILLTQLLPRTLLDFTFTAWLLLSAPLTYQQPPRRCTVCLTSHSTASPNRLQFPERYHIVHARVSVSTRNFASTRIKRRSTEERSYTDMVEFPKDQSAAAVTAQRALDGSLAIFHIHVMLARRVRAKVLPHAYARHVQRGVQSCRPELGSMQSTCRSHPVRSLSRF
ncbi:hypothetical protein BD311DRAFT_227559 [Dichomitus squalens]|uniref:Uncharacterized protein n=1 Tax=Dichomitus squalens TaxID=114155 RepID=A0A4Q9M444_9APHY|nr:hypothetical protein BD311DRAFT_227559 [Dichomitus squalens]